MKTESWTKSILHGVMPIKLGLQTIVSEFDSHWVPYTSALVLN